MPRLGLPWSTALFFPITSHVTLDELLNPFEPQFIYQQKGYSTLPSVPLSKVYLQRLQHNVGLSVFGHTHTASFLSLLCSSFTSAQAKVSVQTPKLSMEPAYVHILDPVAPYHPPNPRPAFSPPQRPPMKSPKSTNSASPLRHPPQLGSPSRSLSDSHVPPAILST